LGGKKRAGEGAKKRVVTQKGKKKTKDRVHELGESCGLLAEAVFSRLRKKSIAEITGEREGENAGVTKEKKRAVGQGGKENPTMEAITQKMRRKSSEKRVGESTEKARRGHARKKKTLIEKGNEKRGDLEVRERGKKETKALPSDPGKMRIASAVRYLEKTPSNPRRKKKGANKKPNKIHLVQKKT